MRSFLVALLLVSASDVMADTIDQSYIPGVGINQAYSTSYSGNLPLGQEFKPTLGSVGFVDLYIGDAGSDIGPGASFSLNLRQGSISGTILGTSNTVFVADNTNLGIGSYANLIATHFTFASPISLTPGSTYVIQIIQQGTIVPGNQNFGLDGGPIGSSTYAGGRAIVGGNPQTTFDFAFKEGTATVPEPSSLALAGLGGIGLVVAALKRRAQQAA